MGKSFRIYRSWMRILRMIVITIVILVVIVPLSMRLLMEIPAVQQRVGNELSEVLRHRLGTTVSIGRVTLSWRGALSVADVRINDQQDSLMLAAKRLDLGLDLGMLLTRGQIVLSQARLFDAFIHIYQPRENDRLNIAFAIDSLSRSSVEPTSSIAINTVLMRGCRVDLHPSPTARHYLLTDIATKIRLLKVNGNEISGDLRHLSFREQSGFVLKDLSGRFELTGREMRIKDFKLSLLDSKVDMPSILLRLPHDGNLASAAIEANIAPSYIRPSDLASLYSPLSELTDHLDIIGQLKADSSRIEIAGLSARYAKHMRLSSSDMRLERMHNYVDSTVSVAQYIRTVPIGQVHLFADESFVDLSVRLLARYQSPLAPWLRTMGLVDLSAEVRGVNAENYRLQIDALTKIGAAKVDAEVTYSDSSLLHPDRVKGFASIRQVEVSKLSPQMIGWGATSAELTFDLQQDLQVYPLSYRGSMSAHVGEIMYRGKTYRNILCSAQTSLSNWRAMLNTSLPEGQIDATISLSRNVDKKPALEFAVDADRLALSTFTSAEIARKTLLSISAKGQLTAFEDIDRICGEVRIDTIRLVNPTDSICLGALSVVAEGDPAQARRIVLQSDYLQGSIGGHFALSRLPKQIETLILAATPSLRDTMPNDISSSTDYCTFDLKLNPLPIALIKYFDLPLRPSKPIRIEGLMDVAAAQFVGRLSSNEILRGSDRLENLYAEIAVDKGRTSLQIKVDASVGTKGKMQGMKITANAVADSLNCVADFGYDASKHHHGTVNFGIQMQRTIDGSLLTNCRILPSRLFLDQIEWQLSASHLIISKDYFDVDHLSLTAPGRSIRANGRISRHAQDSLQLGLKRINLRYVLQVAGVDFDMLDADLSGSIVISDLYGEQRMTAQVESEQFKVNGSDCGSIVAHGTWNKQTQLIEMKATVSAGDTARTDVNGFFQPLGQDAGLDLSFEANHQPIEFVGNFLTGFSSDFGGAATGHVRLFGAFSRLALEGKAIAEQVRITPIFIYTPYILNGAISFSSHSMSFHAMDVKDRHGRSARFEGNVGYNPGFSNFSYDVRIRDAQHLMVYNVSARQNDMIYGQAFASGEARLFGDEHKGTTLVTNLTTSTGTDISLDFGRTLTSESKGMLRFTPFTRPQEGQKIEKSDRDKQLHTTHESSMPFAMSMHIGITPDAKVRLLLDRKSGDGISGNARGDLRIDLDADGKFGVFGKLSLVSGTYGLSLEQVLHKNFVLKEGSTISFAGDPMLATLDLSAMYNLTANLADLDESLVVGLSRSNVPVSCILDLSGSLRNPTLSFDIKLPGSDAELQRRLRSLIDTEDTMTRQIAYLVMLGKFYTPATRRTAGENFTSVAASTLSEQLSYLLGGLSSKVQIGTSIKTSSSTFDDTDIELLLSSQLFDNRLLINGNLGYRDNPYMRNTYVGEFDLEYKLSQSGNLRLKGYSHYNNMYQYLRQSLTTQGIGLLYRKDFNRLTDLLPFRFFSGQAVQPADTVVHSIPTETDSTTRR